MTCIAVSSTLSVLTFGSQGSTVRQLQRNLNARFQDFGVVSLISVLVDGVFGMETLTAVKYLQCVGGLPVNGRVDEATWRFAEQGITGLPVLAIGSEYVYATAVTAVQKTLLDAGIQVIVDGRYGEKTVLAVEAYQKQMRIAASGVVGYETWKRIVRSRLTDVPCIALLPNPYQS